MKIAFYCPNKPLSDPHPSGDLVIARGIRDALIGLGHDCREVARFRSRWFWRSPDGWMKVLRGLAEAGREVRRFAPDLWLTYHSYYKSPDVLGPGLSRLACVPYVLFQPMYGTRRRKDPRTRIGFYLNREALRRATYAFTNNLNDIAALERIIPAARLHYLPPGIFPETFRRDEEAGRKIRERYDIPIEASLLMTAARFRPGVKFDSFAYLFRSLALLRPSQEPPTLLVAGDGPMETRVRALAAELMPGRVVFAGAVARDELFRCYSAADLFVFPGIGESLGMVFLEAQAAGLPVVALDSGGVRQVVRNGETGLLVPPDDGSSLARAVAGLLQDTDARRRMAARAVRFVSEERNLHRNYRELARKLEEIVENQRKR